MEDNLMWMGGRPIAPPHPFAPHGGVGPFEAPRGGPLPGPRVRRGDVRQALLRLLNEEPRNGYQMIEEIARRSSGIWRPSPGSVYPALQQLEDEGLVRAEESGGTRTFRLTAEGRRRAEEWSGTEPWDEVARSMPEDRHELRLLWGQLGEAFVHLTRVASDAQVARTKKLLKNTRREIFKILAEDEEDR